MTQRRDGINMGSDMDLPVPVWIGGVVSPRDKRGNGTFACSHREKPCALRWPLLYHAVCSASAVSRLSVLMTSPIIPPTTKTVGIVCSHAKQFSFWQWEKTILCDALIILSTNALPNPTWEKDLERGWGRSLATCPPPASTLQETMHPYGIIIAGKLTVIISLLLLGKSKNQPNKTNMVTIFYYHLKHGFQKPMSRTHRNLQTAMQNTSGSQHLRAKLMPQTAGMDNTTISEHFAETWWINTGTWPGKNEKQAQGLLQPLGQIKLTLWMGKNTAEGIDIKTLFRCTSQCFPLQRYLPCNCLISACFSRWTNI